jgi:hypothetical protein
MDNAKCWKAVNIVTGWESEDVTEKTACEMAWKGINRAAVVNYATKTLDPKTGTYHWYADGDRLNVIPHKPGCLFNPLTYNGPNGMYHCPECGEMVLAGAEHPDYSL